MNARLPDFIVPGTQKGGTTSLHQLLSRHPQVFLPPCKEVHYFTLHADQPRSWYANHYQTAARDQLCGDITPYYLFHPWVPQRLARLLPEVKLVILLRDPVERCLSQYFHACRLGFESLELMEALKAEPERLAGADLTLQTPGARHRAHQENSYLSRSRYEQQLERYLRVFRREQLLVLQSEAMFSHPQRTLDRILEWLHLSNNSDLGSLPQANAGRRESDALPPRLRKEVRQQLQSTYDALASDWGIHWPS